MGLGGKEKEKRSGCGLIQFSISGIVCDILTLIVAIGDDGGCYRIYADQLFTTNHILKVYIVAVRLIFCLLKVFGRTFCYRSIHIIAVNFIPAFLQGFEIVRSHKSKCFVPIAFVS